MGVRFLIILSRPASGTPVPPSVESMLIEDGQNFLAEDSEQMVVE